MCDGRRPDVQKSRRSDVRTCRRSEWPGSARTSRQTGASATVVSFSAENLTTNCNDVVQAICR